MTEPIACWCGNADIVPFCAGYARCPGCETLVSAEMPAADIAHVVDEDRDFYGREYWFTYQERHLGHPTILDRARSDLSERCLYWLQALLKYRRPPARVLELGSGHGGFVAMLRWAGFDATGLEISPWVVDFSRKTFDVPVLTGPIEDQALDPASLDVIALMDVVEHLREPAATMRQCLRLLKPDGILLIQTPCYPEGSTYEEMAARSEQPLEILQPGEHLYLFSRPSIRELFARLGAPHLAFEPALFAQYDMFAVVSRAALGPISADAPTVPATAPGARLIQALLDERTALEGLKKRQREEVATLHGQAAAVEADRATRLAVIEDQGRKLGEVEAERNILQADVEALRRHREVIEADRAARLEVIDRQGRRLGELEAEANHLRADVNALREHRDMIEADRAARLEVIDRQGRRLGELEADAAARLEIIEALGQQLTELKVEVEAQEQQIRIVMTQLRALQEVVRRVLQTRSYRLLRRLGYWGWMDRVMSQSVLAAVRALHMPGGLSDTRISSFGEYRACIDAFNASQPNKALVDGIRGFNHDTVNELNKVRPLREALVLDIGASPHGYALERVLELGAGLYVGVGLDISSLQVVVDTAGSLGMLLKGDAASLPIASDTFDLVLSLSTFEHVLDVGAVLSEIARVLRVGGRALLTFEPIWSSAYGHRLHHFGECAKVVPPWSHLTHTPEQFQAAMIGRWPKDAPVSLDQAVQWVYFDRELNRLTVRDYRQQFAESDLEVEWMVDLKDPSSDELAAKQAAAVTGLSVEDVNTKGLSVLLTKTAAP